MIKSIEMKNFQAHKNTTIDFSNGLNFLIGNSDNGKSAIIRALDFVVNNKGSDSYISDWVERTEKTNTPKGNMEVTVYTDKGFVKRVKGKDKYYDVNGKVLTAFNRSVPNEVIEFFNLSDLNIQTQDNNFFLLNETNGEVARYLNRIVNLDIIDSSLFNVNSKLKSIKQKTEAKKEEQEELKIQIDSFNFIDELDKMISSIEEKEKHKTDIGEISLEIQSILDRYKYTESELNKIVIVNEYDYVLSLLNICNNTDKLNERIEKIHNLITQYNLAVELTNKHKIIIEHESKINDISNQIKEKDRIEEACNDLTGIIADYYDVNDKLKSFDSIKNIDLSSYLDLSEKIKNIETGKKELTKNIELYNTVNSQIKTKNREWKLLEREYKEIKPDECPLCGGVM